jgi:D-sedoheptulose 7-phosphate isomerase
MDAVINSYITGLQATLAGLPRDKIQQTIDLLDRARLENRQVFILGNGGSASTASHFACDLGKNTVTAGQPRFRVLALTDNMALFSAYANDNGYESVFAEQLVSWVNPQDVVIGISASGNSPNVLKAITLASQTGATTVGFTGFDGGRLAKLVDIEIRVPSSLIEQVEDVHLMLEHLIVTAVRERMRGQIQSFSGEN